MTAAGEHDDILDIVGIGFGPSNVALAIAIEEHNELAPEPLRARFVERQAGFGWHRGMLLDNATMQVTFLKDLVTLRNPASDYSFVSYLHERERLVDFINHKTLFPLRLEFHDYLEWAAARLDHLVTYGRTVTGVQPVVDDNRVVAFDVVTVDPSGEVTSLRARNVVLAVGLTPVVPPGVELGARTWHTSQLLAKVPTMPADPEPQRFVVVGAGQSAAEAVDFLHTRFEGAEVCSVFSRFGYSPADDSPYANRIFDPGAVDTYFGAEPEVKELMLAYHRNTNYSVVDGELIEDLYRREYQEKVKGRPRLRMMNTSRVVGLKETDDEVQVEVEHLPTRSTEPLTADVVVLATGYRSADSLAVLGAAGELAERQADGTPEVWRDYRLALNVPADAAVYVQGATEHTHGIGSTLLSNVAVRAGEILSSVVQRNAAAARLQLNGCAPR